MLAPCERRQSHDYVMHGQFVKSACLFFATLWLAKAQGWTAGDVAWSMWLASFTVGYAFIVYRIAIANPVAQGLFSSAVEGPGLTVVRAGAVLVGLFMLGFFTVHFGMFHFVHAIFLNGFFPLDDLGTEEIFSPSQFRFYFAAALAEYWPFALAAALSQSRLFTDAWRDEKAGDFAAPYKAVIKNHLVIITLGFLTIATPQLNVLAPLLLVYFFPWGEAARLWRNSNKHKQIKAL